MALFLQKLHAGKGIQLTRNQLIAFTILAILCVLGATGNMHASNNQQESQQVRSDYGLGVYGQ